MDNPFQLNPDEAILYRSRPSQHWFSLVGRIGIGILELVIFMFLSFISFTNLGRSVLATFLPTSSAGWLSRVLFQGIVPVLITLWFAEDTVRIFTSELVLTNQRIWTKGAPYAWSAGKETPLTNILSISARRDGVFIRLKNSRKVQTLLFPNGKQIVEAYQRLPGNSNSH